MTATVTLGLLLTTAFSGASPCRLVASASRVRDYFQTLESSRAPMSPVERLVFSLMLANTAPQQKHAQAAPVPPRAS